MKLKKDTIFPRVREFAVEAAVLLVGSVMFGLSVNLFIEPGQITMSGFTGISTTINHFFDTPVGIMMIFLNLPLLFLEWRRAGGVGVLRTGIGILFTSLAVDGLAFIRSDFTDPLLCAVFGGLIMGAGGGLLLTRGYTTGGSDLCAFLLTRKFRRLTTGRVILLIDVAIVVGSSALMLRWTGLLYSFVAVWCYTTAFDRVLEGFGGAKLVMIISDKYEEIARQVSEQMRRGVTLLYGAGWYTKTQRNILLCVIKRSEQYALTNLARRADPGAFVILSNAAEVLGQGFEED
ncbi:MAG: YitT family protein [Clostridiales bacterium]|jgi:uncharacterized membrane-anchored protein YitT (DUF2179 family)|nr:YitT family protein [Clostridiales bacterium]